MAYLPRVLDAYLFSAVKVYRTGKRGLDFEDVNGRGCVLSPIPPEGGDSRHLPEQLRLRPPVCINEIIRTKPYKMATNVDCSEKSRKPKGPFHLVTVNTAPERAKRLIGRVAEDVKDQYTIIHAANCEGDQDVQSS